MLTKFPHVSIALCTFNGEKHIKEQIESLINQDYPNLEIIVVDDCSTDNTWAILSVYASQYKSIRLFRNEENKGYVKNFEKALSLCSGKYIALADQDDIWHISKISTLVNEIGDHCLIYHDSLFVDEKGMPIDNFRAGELFYMYEGDSALPLMLANCISGHAMMFHKDLLTYIDEFDPGLFHDWVISYTAFNIGRVKYIPVALVHYRQHSQSVTDPLKRKSSITLGDNRRGIQMLSVDLTWMKFCAGFKYNKEPDLINQCYDAFLGIRDGKDKIRAFLFLIKSLNLLTCIIRPEKNLFSNINFARKICFG